jgi:hypothetical protein
MRITVHQLRRIIREEAEKTIKYNADPALKGDQTTLPDKLQKAIIDKEDEDTKLQEAWGGVEDTGSDLLEFARAYAGLGGAVQEQVDAIVHAYIEFGSESEFEDVVSRQNVAAIDMARMKLGRFLDAMQNDDSMLVLEALDVAIDWYDTAGDP